MNTNGLKIHYNENTDVVIIRIEDPPEGEVSFIEDSNYENILYAIEDKTEKLIGIQIYSFSKICKKLFKPQLKLDREIDFVILPLKEMFPYYI